MLAKLIKSYLVPFLCFTFLTLQVYASGTLTGTLTTPSTSVPLSNSTLSFNLSQAGVDITNTYNLATTPVTCGTDSTGSVRGIVNPLIAPLASSITSTGSLSGTYYVRIEYYDLAGGHTSPSPVLSVNVTGPNNSISFTAPVLHPFGAVGYTIYVGTVSGSEKLQTTVSGWGSYTLTAYSSGGTAIPSTNTTACTFTFNDSIIPPDTIYRVNVVTSNGLQVSGFPQNWYLTGSSINIATIIPVSNQNARFQNPILSNPLSSYATQSINSPLTLNGYALTVGSIIGQSGSLSLTGAITEIGNIAQTGNLTLTGNETITGTLGVGTLTPAFKVDLQTSGNATQLRLLDTANGTTANDGLLVFDQTTGAGLLNQDPTPFFIGTNNVAHWVMDLNGHVGPIITGGSTGISSNGGTTALETGSNDVAGRILQTVSGATQIGITFGTNAGNTGGKAPACLVMNEITAALLSSVATTTTLQINGTIATNDKLVYHCFRFGS